ncbi:MAG: LolA family protein, partial [Bacteroidia bacterium]
LHNRISHLMKPYRQFALAATALLISVSAFAQQDPKAKAILDEVSKTAKAYTSISATFTITIEKPNGTKDVQEGNVVMKGKKYKVVLNKKVKDKIYKEEYRSNTKVICNYSEQNKEVTVDNAPDPAKATAKNAITPSDIFTIHEKGFKYKFEKEVTENGRVMQLINLYPEKPDGKSYHTVKVKIDKLKKQIVSAVMMNTDGSKMTYSVKTFTPNLTISDTDFEYSIKNYPAGTEEVDLR